MFPVWPSRFATGVLLSDGMSHMLSSVIVLALDAPNGITTSCCHKVLVGTDGKSVDLFLLSVWCLVSKTYPLRLERDLTVADTRPSFPETDTMIVCWSVVCRKGNVIYPHPAVHSMTDIIYG